MVKLLLVAGARPNFMKIAPILREIELRWKDGIKGVLVHTGQHYDHEMSQAFFDDLRIQPPAHFLDVGSGSHAVQTARIMMAFEEVCLNERPDAVVVVGDVNSTVACALVARKLGIGVAHVEAGLRSRDTGMPEEINRMVTDVLSDWLFVSERSGVANLEAEGKPDSSIHYVGNVMVDTLYHQLQLLNGSSKSRWREERYAVMTLHRPSNVDREVNLREIMSAAVRIARDLPVFFPVHPRTRQKMDDFGLSEELSGAPVHLLPPLSYQEFLRIWKDASLVLTDSGGLQEETTALGVPCFTLRDNTERPITLEEGTNTLVGTKADGILAAYEAFRNGGSKVGRIPELWDGKASQRIVPILAKM
jgi:UDP-N-acetylglucosamine 2-epimerase (non-hydrolysing)